MGRLTERLTESDRQGNWWLEGVPWKDTYVGQTITANTSEKIYGALCKLKDYEDTGLTPEEIMDGKLLTGWIPVSERLPDENIQVLAQWEYISRVDNTVIVYTEIMHWNGDTWLSYKGVPVGVTVAWVPLPEMYKLKEEIHNVD